MSAKVTVYTTSNCPYCDAAKRLLDKGGVPYEEIVLARDQEGRERVRELTGNVSFPQIVIGGEPIGGYAELRALRQSGQLAVKLNG